MLGSSGGTWSGLRHPEGVEITIALPKPVRTELPWNVLHALVSRAEAVGVNLLEVSPDDTRVANAWRCAEVATSTGRTRWALFQQAALSPGASWGSVSADSPLVRHRDDRAFTELRGTPVRLVTVEAQRPNTCSVFWLEGQLDGNISALGPAFWRQLVNVSPLLADRLKRGSPDSVEYVDRYLRSPLPARVLYEILRTLRGTPKQGEPQPRLSIKTGESEAEYPRRWLFQDWDGAVVQSETLKALFSSLYLTDVSVARTADLPHVRSLRLTWSDGEAIEVVLDQGVGFVRAVDRVPHAFCALPASQAAAIQQLKFRVRQYEHRVPVYLMPWSNT